MEKVLLMNGEFGEFCRCSRKPELTNSGGKYCLGPSYPDSDFPGAQTLFTVYSSSLPSCPDVTHVDIKCLFLFPVGLRQTTNQSWFIKLVSAQNSEHVRMKAQKDSLCF